MTHPPRATWALTTIVVTTLVFDTLTAGQQNPKQLTESDLHRPINLQIGD